MKIRELISQIRNLLNSVNLDDRLFNRLIYYTYLNYAEIIIKRDSDNRKIFNNINKLTLYNCLELEDVNEDSCISYLKNCNKIKRTIQEISSPFVSNLNINMLYVSSIDDTVAFIQSNPFSYSKSLESRFKSKNKYYWLENNRIYVADSDIEFIKVRGYFQNKETDKFNTKNCSFLDTEISIPSYLLADIIKLTVQDLAQYTKRITKDENSNLNNNEKT